MMITPSHGLSNHVAEDEKLEELVESNFASEAEHAVEEFALLLLVVTVGLAFVLCSLMVKGGEGGLVSTAS